MATTERPLDPIVQIRLRRLNAAAQGIATGLVLGAALCGATLWLVIKGGPVVGPHLSLLGEFLIGYRVTFAGSLLGLLYGFALGFVGGYTVSWLYNRIAMRRDRGASEERGAER